MTFVDRRPGVAGLALLVMRVARTLGAVQLAAHHGQLGHHGGVAYECRDVVGQLFDGDAGHQVAQ